MAMLFQQNWLNKSLGSPAVHFNLSFLAFEILVRQILLKKASQDTTGFLEFELAVNSGNKSRTYSAKIHYMIAILTTNT